MPTPALSGAIDGVASKVAVNAPVSVTPIGVLCHAPSAGACTHTGATGFTISVSVREWVKLVFTESIPVMVIVYVPAGVELEVDTFSVEEPEPPLMEAGVKLAVTPAGEPLTAALKFTVPL